MSFHRFIRALLEGNTFRIFGTGEQTRDFTYVGDAADVTITALEKGVPGTAYNVGGGTRVSLKEVVDIMVRLTKCEPKVVYQDFEKGDMMHTMADTVLAKKDLEYAPAVAIEDGLAAEIEWMRTVLESEA